VLQSARSDYQIGRFESLNRLVENATPIVPAARLKIFFQPLISHCFF
jgi:hypothetical protein